MSTVVICTVRHGMRRLALFALVGCLKALWEKCHQTDHLDVTPLCLWATKGWRLNWFETFVQCVTSVGSCVNTLSRVFF